jgi:hypothetical protein
LRQQFIYLSLFIQPEEMLSSLDFDGLPHLLQANFPVMFTAHFFILFSIYSWQAIFPFDAAVSK